MPTFDFENPQGSSHFDFYSSTNQRKKPRSTLFWFFIGCAVTATIGTTLAAQINLNNNGNVEFGQGLVQSTSCDSDILVTPINSFANESQGGRFTFNAIQVQHVDEACKGVDFLLKVYDNNGNLVALTENESSTVKYYEARVSFNPLTSDVLIESETPDPNSVSISGFWANQFSLAGAAPIEIGTLNNLVEIDSDFSAGDPALNHFAIGNDNGFQISFNPSSQLIAGFADTRDVYRITLETVSRER